MHLQDHLVELKKRLYISGIFFLVAFVICYCYSDIIMKLLLDPLVSILSISNHKIIYTNLAEAFFTHIKLAIYSSLMVSIPFLLLQTYFFILPALYKKEKKLVKPFFIISLLLFYVGAIFAYKFIMPQAFKFFLSFENQSSVGDIPLEFQAKISEYLDLVLHFILVFAISFELPIIIVLLVKLELLSIESLIKKRKIAIVIIFIIAAIITPPDVLSQIGLAVPMVILYELSIISCKYIKKV